MRCRAAAQVLTVFFASFIAGSFLNQIQQFAAAPATILSVLGTAAPQTATFFMSYLLLLGFTTKPLLFLRLTGARPARPRPRPRAAGPCELCPLTALAARSELSSPSRIKRACIRAILSF